LFAGRTAVPMFWPRCYRKRARFGWMLAFPGTAHNSTDGCDRSRTDWLVLSTNRILNPAAGWHALRPDPRRQIMLARRLRVHDYSYGWPPRQEQRPSAPTPGDQNPRHAATCGGDGGVPAMAGGDGSSEAPRAENRRAWPGQGRGLRV